jgi:TPR repeat protein
MLANLLIAAALVGAGSAPDESRMLDEIGKLSSLDRCGEAVMKLRGLSSPTARAMLAAYLYKDDPDLRSFGVNSFDPEEALRMAEGCLDELKSEAKTDPRAARALAYFYYEGIGIPADQRLAFRWYRWAADKADPASMRRVGNCFLFGTGVEKDPKQGFAWLKRSAEAGDVRATLEMGFCYEEGDGVAKNPVLANTLFEKAARGGSLTAMRRCSFKAMENAIKALEKNDIKAYMAFQSTAAKWFAQASAGGDLDSARSLAEAGRTGLIPVLPIEVFREMSRASKSGLSRPLAGLAALLLEGYGCEVDGERADTQLDLAIAAAKRENDDAWRAELERVKTSEGIGKRAETIREVLGWPTDEKEEEFP